ncbi:MULTISPECIES: hypothetical protein [unclassified Sulfitobacter]|uniref:lipopolysaccharide biosynthesis protein n=1 Tax=unclassified Sulfitobacter TaxID=196795 RepID=UPI0023E2E78B|nr:MULTISPECIES: hypothetical protein [unclassified Sulfitobacter]MDF3384583.1 hypothetical protein [Sulfitobacter sp. Ks11]MDF3388072.1 hypothetical protein [Sulfitobacter sp. M85]MDF3391492.1 hypothetical protein [Sulfitobacter sp. Ks16]MDF3402059.1 hypothetical protein [Sulfitobacter sp. KE39]MDF3405551.1 hypothetical protein [Sulfitobacter sp. Ks35]
MKRVFPFASAFCGRFLSAAGVLVLSMILSHQLSLTEAGLFFEAFIALMGLAIALQFGMPLMILRKIARLRDNLTETDAILARSLSTIYALSSIVAFAWIVFFFTTSGFTTPLSWVWINLLPVALMGPLSAFIKAKGRPGWGGFWEVGVLSLIGSAAILAVQADSAMETWIIFSVSCWVGMLLAMILAGMRHLKMFTRPIPDISLLLEGRFLWAMSVLAYISLWGGVIIANWLLDEASTAVLNALFRTLAPLQFLMLTVDFYMAPKFAAAHGAELRRLYTKARITCAIMAIPYVTVTLATPSLFLSLLYGDKYALFGTELRLIIIAFVVEILLGPAGILLNMHNRDRITLLCMGVKTLLYFSLGIWLGVAFGVTGIVLALALSIMAKAFLQYILMAQRYLYK